MNRNVCIRATGKYWLDKAAVALVVKEVVLQEFSIDKPKLLPEDLEYQCGKGAYNFKM